MNRRREIAKRWHPDAHPNASPEEKERLGKRFAEEMAKLDREERRAKSDYEPGKWPSPDDSWWDEQSDDDERERQSDIHRRQRAWQAEQERRQAEQAAKAAEAEKAARDARAQERERQARDSSKPYSRPAPVGWQQVVVAPAFVIPLGAALACLLLPGGSCWQSPGIAMVTWLGVVAYSLARVDRERSVAGRAAAAQKAAAAKERAERERLAQEARAARRPYNESDLPLGERIKKKALVFGGLVAAVAIFWAIAFGAIEVSYRARWEGAIYSDATVVDVERKEWVNSRGHRGATWWVTVEFAGMRGKVAGEGFYRGQTVRVRYLPGKADHQRFCNDVELVR